MAQKLVDAACERARDDARNSRPRTEPDGRKRTRRWAIGDPQAPFETFLGILDLHGALGPDGRLVPDVQLVSMGDHFDWGTRADRGRAAADGVLLLSWLAAHAPDHVAILAGNHDLGRVCELARFDDASFALAQAEADVVYRDGAPDPVLESRFLALHPDVPTAEVVARDFGCFLAAQRDLVLACLRSKRMQVAHAAQPDLLLLHAGLTRDDLVALKLPPRAEAPQIAAALNAALVEAIAGWSGTPLSIPGLHVPGSAAYGEGRGIFYHRPGNPGYEIPEAYTGPPRRRFDPRTLPIGLTQAIGHIRDSKCRRLLRDWVDGATAKDGPLRQLRTDGTKVSYRSGAIDAKPDPAAATMLFLDGGMLHAAPAEYELLDLDRRQPVSRDA